MKISPELIIAEAPASEPEAPVVVDEKKVDNRLDDVLNSDVVKTVTSDGPKTSKLPEPMSHSDEPPGT